MEGSRKLEVGNPKLVVGSRKLEVGRPFSAFVHNLTCTFDHCLNQGNDGKELLSTSYYILKRLSRF